MSEEKPEQKEPIKSKIELKMEELAVKIAGTDKTEIRKAYFLEALELNLGIVTQTCRATGIPKSTYYNWRKTDIDFKANALEVDEVVVDFTESALYKRVQMGDTTAIIFTLKTKGKRRGWVESINIRHGIDRGQNAELDEVLANLTPLQRAKILGHTPPQLIKGGQDADNVNVDDSELD